MRGGLTITGNENRDDETVLCRTGQHRDMMDGESRECMSMEMTYDTDDTGHNDRDGTLHHEIRSEDGHGGDSDTRLGSPVAMRAVNGQWCCSLCLCV